MATSIVAATTYLELKPTRRSSFWLCLDRSLLPLSRGVLLWTVELCCLVLRMHRWGILERRVLGMANQCTWDTEGGKNASKPWTLTKTKTLQHHLNPILGRLDLAIDTLCLYSYCFSRDIGYIQQQPAVVKQYQSFRLVFQRSLKRSTICSVRHKEIGSFKPGNAPPCTLLMVFTTDPAVTVLSDSHPTAYG